MTAVNLAIRELDVVLSRPRYVAAMFVGGVGVLGWAVWRWTR